MFVYLCVEDLVAVVVVVVFLHAGQAWEFCQFSEFGYSTTEDLSFQFIKNIDKNKSRTCGRGAREAIPATCTCI